jgi:hypothetical protein
MHLVYLIRNENTESLFHAWFMRIRHHISTMLSITWTERWLGDGLAEVIRFSPIGFLLVVLCEEHCLPG